MVHTWWLPLRRCTIPENLYARACNFVQNGLATLSIFVLQLWVILFYNKHIFLDYFQKAHEKIIREDAYFEYKFNKVAYKVLTRNIMFFESTGRIINVHNKDFTGKFYGKLNTIERKLKDGKVPFLRIHQSYLVNYGFIKEITFSKVVLTNGIQLQISEERQKMIRAKYTSFLCGEFLDG